MVVEVVCWPGTGKSRGAVGRCYCGESARNTHTTAAQKVLTVGAADLGSRGRRQEALFLETGEVALDWVR